MPETSPLRAQLGLKVAEAAHAAGIPVPELAKGPTAAQPPAQAPAQPSASQTPGPDAAAVANAANMTAQQREAMIRGMVANLAAKQAADPSNLDGWLRLGRAYAVLHETDKAADAYEKAAHLKPGDTSILLQEVQALLTDHTPAEKLPQAVIVVLKRAEAIDPEQPFVLWYLGLAAAQDAHPEQAREYWSRLLKKIPAGGDDTRMVKSAIDSLSKP
jgi:cytochrome c-type biogenesis protein CcmH